MRNSLTFLSLASLPALVVASTMASAQHPGAMARPMAPAPAPTVPAVRPAVPAGINAPVSARDHIRTPGAAKARSGAQEAPSRARATALKPSPTQARPGQASPRQASPGQASPGQASPGATAALPPLPPIPSLDEANTKLKEADERLARLRAEQALLQSQAPQLVAEEKAVREDIAARRAAFESAVEAELAPIARRAEELTQARANAPDNWENYGWIDYSLFNARYSYLTIHSQYRGSIGYWRDETTRATIRVWVNIETFNIARQMLELQLEGWNKQDEIQQRRLAFNASLPNDRPAALRRELDANARRQAELARLIEAAEADKKRAENEIAVIPLMLRLVPNLLSAQADMPAPAPGDVAGLTRRYTEGDRSAPALQNPNATAEDRAQMRKDVGDLAERAVALSADIAQALLDIEAAMGVMNNGHDRSSLSEAVRNAIGHARSIEQYVKDKEAERARLEAELRRVEQAEANARRWADSIDAWRDEPSTQRTATPRQPGHGGDRETAALRAKEAELQRRRAEIERDRVRVQDTVNSQVTAWRAAAERDELQPLIEQRNAIVRALREGPRAEDYADIVSQYGTTRWANVVRERLAEQRRALDRQIEDKKKDIDRRHREFSRTLPERQQIATLNEEARQLPGNLAQVQRQIAESERRQRQAEAERNRREAQAEADRKRSEAQLEALAKKYLALAEQRRAAALGADVASIDAEMAEINREVVRVNGATYFGAALEWMQPGTINVLIRPQ